jgi:RNA polymerase sigma-70 factor, ECF subfamily
MNEAVEQKFASLVQPHFSSLFRTAVRLTRRRADAEDLVQEVCLRAYTKLGDLAGATNPRAWLMRALYHLFVDLHRRRRREKSVALGDDDAAGGLPSEGPSPEQAVDAGRLHERLATVWHRLEPEQRALLSLHAEGHDFDELTAIFGINKNALSARLHRARLRLAKLLALDERAPALQLVGTER